MKKLQNDINAKMFYALKISEVSKVPFLFMSAPGMGKSTSVEMFAKVRDYELVILRGNSTSESEVMGYDVVDAVNPASKSTKHLRPSWYEQVMQNAANGKKTLLFLDEITTAPEYVQSALLHLIFERKVGMEEIPEDTLIVSAGNYSQSLGNNFGLIPPLMNRFCIFNIVPTVKDLDVFLNTFEGSLIGKPKDKISVIKKQILDLDRMALDIPEEDLGKIGEYIETGIKEQTKILATSGKKVLDLAVTEMSGLYQDTNNDAILRGFVTLRTLNYYVKVVIAAYTCFGKEGLTCPGFRLITQGLVGTGLSRDNSTKNVIFTDVDKQYFDQIGLVLEEIEKLKNTAVPAYNKFLGVILGKVAMDDGTVLPLGEKSVYTDAQINSIINKFSEMKKDPKMSGIARPIDQDYLTSLCDMILYNANENANKLKINTASLTTNPVQDYKIDELVSCVVRWNYLNDLLCEVKTVVTTEDNGYSELIVNKMNSSVSDIKRHYQKLRTMINLFKKYRADEFSLIPEVHTTSLDLDKSAY